MNKILLSYTRNPPQICRICIFSMYTDPFTENMECQICEELSTFTTAYREGCPADVFLKKLLEVI